MSTYMTVCFLIFPLRFFNRDIKDVSVLILIAFAIFSLGFGSFVQHIVYNSFDFFHWIF
jgi:hypothetical protein